MKDSGVLCGKITALRDMRGGIFLMTMHDRGPIDGGRMVLQVSAMMNNAFVFLLLCGMAKMLS